MDSTHISLNKDNNFIHMKYINLHSILNNKDNWDINFNLLRSRMYLFQSVNN